MLMKMGSGSEKNSFGSTTLVAIVSSIDADALFLFRRKANSTSYWNTSAVVNSSCIWRGEFE
jgi:hypothetical protein